MLFYVFKRHLRFQLYQEKFVETKGAIKRHKTKKDRPYNGRKGQSEAINQRRTDHTMVTRGNQKP